jgi:hypothetical protein
MRKDLVLLVGKFAREIYRLSGTTLESTTEFEKLQNVCGNSARKT